tara:strand:- start:1218 stop:1586 length:369 start_codon:yes stop_codon:yes gene_type:complete
MNRSIQIFFLISFCLFATSCADCNEIDACMDFDACNYLNSNPCYEGYTCCDNVHYSNYNHQCYLECEEYEAWEQEGNESSGGFVGLIGGFASAFCPNSYVHVDSLCKYPEDYGWINCNCEQE